MTDTPIADQHMADLLCIGANKLKHSAAPDLEGIAALMSKACERITEYARVRGEPGSLSTRLRAAADDIQFQGRPDQHDDKALLRESAGYIESLEVEASGLSSAFVAAQERATIAGDPLRFLAEIEKAWRYRHADLGFHGHYDGPAPQAGPGSSLGRHPWRVIPAGRRKIVIVFARKVELTQIEIAEIEFLVFITHWGCSLRHL